MAPNTCPTPASPHTDPGPARACSGHFPPRVTRLPSPPSSQKTNPSPSSVAVRSHPLRTPTAAQPMAGPTPTYSAVVSHTAAFLAELVADPLLRRHLLSAAAAADGGGGQQHPAATLQALSLVSDALDTAASGSASPSSLRAADRLLRSLPAATPLSCLLLALARAARRGSGAAAAAAVLDLFALDPALARHELAPAAFEALFAPRLLPVMRHFAARRAAATAKAMDEEGGSDEATAMSTMRVLSLMSGAQAQVIRALEREYEKVLDANCRAYALYLKRILEAGEQSSSPSPQPPPPELVFGVGADEDSRGDDDDAPENDESAASSQSELRDNVIPRHNAPFFSFTPIPILTHMTS